VTKKHISGPTRKEYDIQKISQNRNTDTAILMEMKRKHRIYSGVDQNEKLAVGR
jgi:hypothetical protein